MEKIDCKGMIFRANVSHFHTTNKNGITIEYRIQLYQQKRKSCPGCKECSWAIDCIPEISIDTQLGGIKDAKNGQLYKIVADEEGVKVQEVVGDSYSGNT